jgi:AcrR family transcriptional regulator
MDRDQRQDHGRATAAQRRTQIIGATMRLLACNGVATLSTRTIAREAQVNLGTLHHLFGHKDDLLLAVLDAATSVLIGALVAVDCRPGGGLRAALTESFATLCAMLDREPPLPLVRCEVLLYARRRSMHSASALQQQRYLEALQVCYRVACVPGELLIASDELAAVVSSSIDGLALQTAAGVSIPQQEATRMQVLRSLLALVTTLPSGQEGRDDGTDWRSVRLLGEGSRAV